MTEAAPTEPRGADDGPPGRVSHNAVVLSVATVAARLSAFALAVVMGRHLGPSGYGLYGYAAALGFVLVPFADLGLTPYLTREVARDRARGEALLDRILRIRVATSLGLVGLVGLAAVATGTSWQTLAVIVLVVGSGMVDGLSLVFFGYFAGRERMMLEAALTAGTAVVRAIGGIAMVVVTGELVPAAAWMLAAGLGQTVWASLRAGSARRHRLSTSPPVSWRSALSLGITAIAVMVYLRADTVLVGWILSDRDVGWYAAAYTLLLGLQIVPHMISRALFPVFARTWSANEHASFDEAWQGGVRAVLLISLPLSLAVSLLAGPVMARFFGAGFGAAGGALAILAWSSPLAALNTIASGALRGAGRDGLVTRVSVAGALGNIGVNLWAIPVHGIKGAAAVTVGTEAVVLLAQTAPAIATSVVRFPVLPYARLGLSLLALAAVAVPLRSQTMELALMTSLGAYSVVLMATGGIHTGDLAAARAVLRRRPR